MGRVAAAKRRTGGGVRGRAQRQQDSLNNAIQVRVDVRVPESQRTKTGAAKDCIAHRIVVRVKILAMLATVDFDHQSLLEADKVQVEADERRLASEVKALGPQLSKLNP
jgi:hypothetical protein